MWSVPKVHQLALKLLFAFLNCEITNKRKQILNHEHVHIVLHHIQPAGQTLRTVCSLRTFSISEGETVC